MKKFLILLYLWYLRLFAKIQLRKINPTIVGVGGASGKSSTAFIISKILDTKYKVKQGKGKNSETGIPLNILDIDNSDYTFFGWIKIIFLAPWKALTNYKKYDFLVVEMGIDSPFAPKNMDYLLKIVQPKTGVLTNISLEHSVNFDPLVSAEAELEREKEILNLTAKEEGLLLKSIPESGRSILNIDNPYIKQLLPLKSKTVTVSMNDKTSDFYISKITVDNNSFTVDFIFLKDEHQIKISQPLPKYFAYSFVLSIAVSFSFGINIKDSIKSVEENFSLPPGRFSVFKGIKDTTIIDSSYNSSPEAAKGALELLNLIAKENRKVGILGDMRELGSLSRLEHARLAREIVKNLDSVILIGPIVSKYVAPVLLSSRFDFKTFQSFKESRETILKEIKEKDVVFIKGSQNTLFLERAVELLLLDPTDKSKLCRRGVYWDKKRKNTQ